MRFHETASSPAAGIPAAGMNAVKYGLCVQEIRSFNKPLVEFIAVQISRRHGDEVRSIGRQMRDAWGCGVAGGTIDIQKINIAAALTGRRFDQRRPARHGPYFARRVRPITSSEATTSR